jgi:hypothetical protein
MHQLFKVVLTLLTQAVSMRATGTAQFQVNYTQVQLVLKAMSTLALRKNLVA